MKTKTTYLKQICLPLFLFFTLIVAAQTSIGSPIATEEYVSSVQLSDDGNRLAALFSDLTNNSTEVRVYEWSGTDWDLLGGIAYFGTLRSFNDFSFSGDGNTFSYTGQSIHDCGIFNGITFQIGEWNGMQWADISPASTGITLSTRLSRDGQRLIGADRSFFGEYPGRVTMYQRDGTSWQHIATISEGSSDGQFGSFMSLSDDGSRMIVSARTEKVTPDLTGDVGIFELTDSVWTKMNQGDLLTLGESSDVSLSGNGNHAIAHEDEALLLYAWNGQLWELVQKIPMNIIHIQLQNNQQMVEDSYSQIQKAIY